MPEKAKSHVFKIQSAIHNKFNCSAKLQDNFYINKHFIKFNMLVYNSRNFRIFCTKIICKYVFYSLSLHHENTSFFYNLLKS